MRWIKEQVKPGTEYSRKWMETPKGLAYKARQRIAAKKYRAKNRAQVVARQKQAYADVRLEVMRHYSPDGVKCKCCGESTLLFLTFDHVNNDGAEERKKLAKKLGYTPGGNSMAYYLKKNNYPEGIQVLCMNCNHGKMRNNGICPHQLKNES